MEYQQNRKKETHTLPIKMPKISESKQDFKKLVTPARLGASRLSKSPESDQVSPMISSKLGQSRPNLPRINKLNDSLDKSSSSFFNDCELKESFRLRSKIDQHGLSNSFNKNDYMNVKNSTDDHEQHEENEPEEESYESFMAQFKEREESPLPANRVWSHKMINTKRATNDSQRKIKEKLKLASFMSDEAVYALLKSYEDLLYEELRRIYPTNDKITRMNTQAYIKLPKIKSSDGRTRQTPSDNGFNGETNDLRREFTASQQLERAMHMIDEIKRRKGELTARNSYRPKDLVSDYENWKKNCYSKLRI